MNLDEVWCSIGHSTLDLMVVVMDEGMALVEIGAVARCEAPSSTPFDVVQTPRVPASVESAQWKALLALLQGSPDILGQFVDGQWRAITAPGRCE